LFGYTVERRGELEKVAEQLDFALSDRDILMKIISEK